MVMTTPAISALMGVYPNAEFTLLTSADGKRTLGNFNKRLAEYILYKRGGFLPFLSRKSIAQKIVDARFDHIYCFEFHPEYERLFSASKAKIHRIQKSQDQKHYAQLCLDLVSDVHGQDVGFHPLYLPVTEEAIKNNTAYLSHFGIHDKILLVAIHPTFSGAGRWFRSQKHVRHKLWPPSAYAALSDRLAAYGKSCQKEIKIVMNLMPEECWYGEKIIQASHGSLEILSPPPNFQHYKAFLKRINLLITPDTGPMHIATALGTKLVVLFSGKDPADCGPFAPPEQFKVLRAEETETPEKGISAIGIEAVFNACVQMLN